MCLRDEYFSRFALALDTFSSKTESNSFEDAVSVAASFINASHQLSEMIDLMFLGSQKFTVSSGKGISEHRHMLQILSSVQLHPSELFSQLSSQLKSHIPFLSGLIFVCFELNNEKMQLIKSLTQSNILLKTIVISPEPDKTSETWLSEIPSLSIQVFQEGDIKKHLAVLKESL